jgi:hypothetical protein
MARTPSEELEPRVNGEQVRVNNPDKWSGTVFEISTELKSRRLRREFREMVMDERETKSQVYAFNTQLLREKEESDVRFVEAMIEQRELKREVRGPKHSDFRKYSTSVSPIVRTLTTNHLPNRLRS